MELALSSLSVTHFGAALHFPSQWTRISKQSKLFLPKFTIISKFNELKAISNHRRSAHYHPSIWDPKLIDSLSTPYTYESYAARLEQLKGDTKKILKSTGDPLALLKLVDSVQRLGVAYHFEKEIKEAIDQIANSNFTNADLYTTSLQFRLLREHAYPITSEVFDKFRSRDGRFMDSLSSDPVGLLSLYEASHLGMNGEDVLEEARNFSIRNLKSVVGKLETSLAKQVKHALDIPLHWRMPRLEACNFVNVYQNLDTKSTSLLELAKLDYNIVQSVYQREVKELSMWWQDLGFREKLSFSRDRLMENYLWAMGIVFEPRLSKCRIGLTKFVCILTSIDDMYDVYGSLDELEYFTDAVNRWDIKAMEDLPEYMKICYLAMFNFANEVTYDVLKDHGLNILPHIRKEWTNLCRSYLVEARWFKDNYAPTVDGYLDNGWISVGGPAAMVHAYFLQGSNIKENSPHYFKHCSKLFYWSSLITRLSDDLGTSKDEIMRGDVWKSVQCYIIEEGISEEQARTRVNDLISFSWKKLNEEIATYSFPKSVVSMSLNMARTAQCIFQHGDGIGTSIGVTKDHLISLIVEPIPVEGCNATRETRKYLVGNTLDYC